MWKPKCRRVKIRASGLQAGGQRSRHSSECLQKTKLCVASDKSNSRSFAAWLSWKLEILPQGSEYKEITFPCGCTARVTSRGHLWDSATHSLAWWPLESHGTGWAWLHLVPPTCQSSQTACVPRGGGAMMPRKMAPLASTLVRLPWDANPETSQGVQKVINRKPAASPIFHRFQWFGPNPETYLETLKKSLLNGNRERRLKLAASYFDGTRGI